ncbi:AMP-binding enzyme [Kordiimonas gwangyangensis]|uniref:AMP-binding enzyme n=1 Tax=Kordiimonas gwangyangensis TaxID=288022 RepID=UPI0009DD03E3|nr:hypothetical protein [Kordiimonas gwangyangensis]
MRRLPGGAYDHLGRLDSQVKLRGYRIELGEIEAVLSDHADVRQVAVLVENDALVAHIAGNGEDQQSYLEHCAKKLPHYMVPHKVTLHAQLPINANGKLDRRAVQAGEFTPTAVESCSFYPHKAGCCSISRRPTAGGVPAGSL